MVDCLAAAIDAINSIVPVTADYSQQLVAAKCRALMHGYHQRWGSFPFTVLGVEEMLQSDLWNPATDRKSRSFKVAGKIDVRARRNGRDVIIDHKTCSEDITDPHAPYWRQLAVESQLSHYMLLEWLNNRKVDEGVWDVVRKPSISPKKLAFKEASGVILSGQYLGVNLSVSSLKQLEDPECRETLEMYEVRLRQDCTAIRRDWYFQRRTIPRLDSEIAEYAGELWEHGQEMLHTIKTDRHPRNSGACMRYGGPCKFLGICSGHDTADSDNWQPKSQVHSELPLLDGDGRGVLTNSRISTFQTCRRLHYFQYVLGIERIDEEERESLFFGTVWHAAQEAWWRFQQHEETNNVNAASSQANEVWTTNAVASF